MRDEKGPEVNGEDGCSTIRMHFIPLNCTLKDGLNGKHYVLHILPQFEIKFKRVNKKASGAGNFPGVSSVPITPGHSLKKPGLQGEGDTPAGHRWLGGTQVFVWNVDLGLQVTGN